MSGAPPSGRQTIRLTTIGAKSGKPRMATLYATPDGDGLVIVGSGGGSARNPAWVHNLRAHPVASVKVGGAVREMRAREATGRERERLWELVTTAFSLYATYQRRTPRLLPIFVLEPAAEPS